MQLEQSHLPNLQTCSAAKNQMWNSLQALTTVNINLVFKVKSNGSLTTAIFRALARVVSRQRTHATDVQ